MTLRAALESGVRWQLAIASLPDQPQTTKRAAEIVALLGEGAPPPTLEALNELAPRLVREIERDALIPVRDLRRGCYCLWDVDTPLAGTSAVLRKFLARIYLSGRRSTVRALATAYFIGYAPRRDGIADVGAALAALMPDGPDNLKELHARFAVFDPEDAAERVALHCFHGNIAPHAFLRGKGLSEIAATGGFGGAVYRAGMNEFRARMSRSPSRELARMVLGWADQGGRFADRDSVLANTLLLPFETREPEDELGKEILDALLERVGDPRTKPHAWTQMPEAAAVARRWLDHLSLRHFLEVVDEVAYRNHWDYRRAFWMALLNHGAISSAWVAFGHQGAARARRAFGDTASFGVLEAQGKAVEPGHAVLLVRIGAFVFVDWSHNGRCIAWRHDDPKAPKLYEGRYLSGALAPRRAPVGGLEISHNNSPGYLWQRRVADFIADKTGNRISTSAYAVGGRRGR